MLWEEFFVVVFKDIYFRIVEVGVVVGGAVFFFDETVFGISRGVGVRVGYVVGCILGDLFFVFIFLRVLGSDSRFLSVGMLVIRILLDVWLGFRRG